MGEIYDGGYKAPNAGLQLRRASAFKLNGKGHLRSTLSRRQLQGFVGLHGEKQLTYEIS